MPIFWLLYAQTSPLPWAPQFYAEILSRSIFDALPVLHRLIIDGCTTECVALLSNGFSCHYDNKARPQQSVSSTLAPLLIRWQCLTYVFVRIWLHFNLTCHSRSRRNDIVSHRWMRDRPGPLLDLSQLLTTIQNFQSILCYFVRLMISTPYWIRSIIIVDTYLMLIQENRHLASTPR